MVLFPMLLSRAVNIYLIFAQPVLIFEMLINFANILSKNKKKTRLSGFGTSIMANFDSKFQVAIVYMKNLRGDEVWC